MMGFVERQILWDVWKELTFHFHCKEEIAIYSTENGVNVAIRITKDDLMGTLNRIMLHHVHSLLRTPCSFSNACYRWQVNTKYVENCYFTATCYLYQRQRELSSLQFTIHVGKHQTTSPPACHVRFLDTESARDILKESFLTFLLGLKLASPHVFPLDLRKMLWSYLLEIPDNDCYLETRDAPCWENPLSNKRRRLNPEKE